MHVKDKKVLVFGGTSGIGLAACIQLRDLGASVVAISRDPSKVKNTEGIAVAKCDVRDRDSLTTLFEEQAPFDVIVSAATGGERAVGPFMEMDLDAYQASFDKLWGYTNVVRLGVGHLPVDGCVVLVSGAPARRPKPGQVALSCVGASVEQFVRTVAAEIAPTRINVVSPGVIETPMFGPDTADRKRKLSDATARQPIQRPGHPDEVAKAILFLIQNDFATGTTVDVDGGWLIAAGL